MERLITFTPNLSGMMKKEEKAFKLLRENRVVLEDVTKSGMVFKVVGDHGTYTVIVDFITKKITCECRWSQINPDVECSHVIAVKEFIKQNYPDAIRRLIE